MVLLSFISIILAMLPLAEARVDARFIIKDLSGRQIYMRTPDGKIIFGNVVAGQEIIFDASASNSMYPIDRYYWDFDGDGKYDASGKNVTWAYEKNGYYFPELKVIDYDLKYNFTKRVIRVDCLNGSIEEKEGVINIKNRYDHTVNLTIVVNNDETVNVSVEKEMSVKVPISTSLNEICVEYNGKKTVILFEGDEVDIVVDKNGVHKATGKSPGMEFLFIIAALIMIFLMRRK